MTHQTPTPVPDHGTGWGLLFLFLALYGLVALLGVGTVVAVVRSRFDRRVSAVLQYLHVTLLLAVAALAGFTVLVSARAGAYDVVALLLLVVFLPVGYSLRRQRDASRGWLAALAHAAMAWSLPAFVAFGVLAFVGTRAGGIPPAVAGAVAVAAAVAGTALVERTGVVPGGRVSRG